MNIQFKTLHFSLWNPAVEAVEALKKHRVVASAIGGGSIATIKVLVAPRNLDTATLINKVLTKIALRYSGKNVNLSVSGDKLVLNEEAVEKPVVKAVNKVAKKATKVKEEKPEPKKRVGRKPKASAEQAQEITDEPPLESAHEPPLH
jgi:hypothetical protein